MVPRREKEQRGEKSEGGKHEGLKPTDAEEAGVFLNRDIGESKKEGGEEGPRGGDPVGLIGPPSLASVLRRNRKKDHREGSEKSSTEKA